MRYAGVVTWALALLVDAALVNVIAVVVTAAVALIGSLFDSNLKFDFLGGVPVLFDPLRRGPHDRAARTVVRWVPAEQPVPVPRLLTPGAATSPGAPPPHGS